MSDLDFWDSVSGDCGLPQPSEDQVRKLVTADASRMHAIDEAAAHLLSDLRSAGYNLGLLTNMPATHASVVMESVWAQRYIKIFCSLDVLVSIVNVEKFLRLSLG